MAGGPPEGWWVMQQDTAFRRLVTLKDLAKLYIKDCADFARGPTLRHRLNCWSRFISCNLPITTTHFKKFRMKAAEAGLSAATIETTIGDVLTILRNTDQVVPKRGRRLRLPPKNTAQPIRTEVGRVYRLAETAQWPQFTIRDRMRRRHPFREWKTARYRLSLFRASRTSRRS